MNGEKIVIGCNYHTTWQRNTGMRFVLIGIKDNKALLMTRRTNRKFYTNISDLIFIESEYNKNKAKKLQNGNMQFVNNKLMGD